MTSDFNALYASLGVDPDCDVDTLKRLFRRRIAELHPDRGATLSEEELMQLYLEALRFHRRHGRFPGSRVRVVPLAQRAIEARLPRFDLVAPAPAPRAGPPRHVRTVTLLALLGLVLLGIWAIDDGEPVTAGTAAPRGSTAG